MVPYQGEITRQNEELDRRRHEAEEASGRKTRLLASASHDIRNGLHVLNLLTEVMRQSAERPSVAAGPADNLERLRANLVSFENLDSDLADMSRLDSGRPDLKASTFSLSDLLAGQCRDLAPLAQAKALRLGAELPETPLWLCTDRGKLSRVLSNLIGNAIKFTEAGGITVSAVRSPDGDVLIRVHDIGVGIAPEQLERVFDEFTQLDDTAGGRNKGWGLGLAICRRMINAMGGAVGVESTLGQRTTPSILTRYRGVLGLYIIFCPGGAIPSDLPVNCKVHAPIASVRNTSDCPPPELGILRRYG